MTAILQRFPSILHALLAQAEHGSDGPTMTLVPERGQAEPWRYDTLLETAARSAAVLAEHGVRHGDRVLLCLPTSWQFVTAFFGAQLLGAAPAAIAMPTGFGGAAGLDGQLKDLVGYLRPAAIVTMPAVVEAVGDLAGTVMVDGWAMHARATANDAPKHPVRLPADDQLAFIQCTSGSTGAPKGVMILHANLVANCEQMMRASDWADETAVSWLPLYHDMGLMLGMLLPVYAGAEVVLMPPTRFLRTPAEWLRQVSTYRATLSAAPNFAYGYAVSRVRDEELDGVDLSSWRKKYCGAEPVNPVTLQRFSDRFARWGMPANGLVPCYGMAEATLAISFARLEDPILFDTIDRESAAAQGRVVDVDPHAPGALRVVDCGAPCEGTEVRVVDAAGTPLGENEIGHIQFRGPSRTVGYFGLPEETAASIDSPGWWKTGDVGYLRDGRVRITGRAKDLIIIRGANYFPSDFEQAAETVPGVRVGAVVAVGYQPDDGDTEELHMIVETEVEAAQHESLRRAVSAAVSSRTGVPAAAIHLVPKRSIPKTTSGKLQRSKARRLFVEGWSPSRV